MAHQPSLAAAAKSNVYDEELFRAVVTFGASAVSSVWGKDITFARNSAGRYTLTLPQLYRRLTHVSLVFQDATGVIFLPVVDEDNVATAGTVVFEVRTETGTASDPASGDKLFVTVGVTRNVLNDGFTV
jgi:hypothetical protein